MTTFSPRAALRDRVAAIDVVDSAGGAQTVVPSAGAVLGFQVQGRVRAGDALLSTAGVTGIQPTARTYSYETPTTSILVRFTPQGAACLGAPASALASRSVALDDLLPAACVREAQGRLVEAREAQARVAIIEELLLGLPFARDRLVTRAIDLLDATSGEEPAIAAVARALGLSERQLERRFLQRVGVTPKRFATLRRFERAAALAVTAPSLTDAALAAGYYDQSHFIRDFRRFTGEAPGALLRRAR